MTKHDAPFQLIQKGPSCKRSNGPISLLKVLYFPGVFLLEGLVESLAKPYSMRLTEAFAIIRKVVDTEALYSEKERLIYEAEKVCRFEFSH